ncbi:MAG: hypothetical protein JO265_16505 [Acidimicrobiia bacterium]|nr:hypothetical protein [Acidimicrobiia bacterium]
MLRHALLVAVLVVAAAAGGGGIAGAVGGSGGVAHGTPVTVRANPDNSIVAATRQAAANVGLGAVSAVGFSPDCSQAGGQVVVCRNPSLHKHGARAVTILGPNSCVVRADPAVGGSPHGVNVMTKALRKCITS